MSGKLKEHTQALDDAKKKHLAISQDAARKKTKKTTLTMTYTTKNSQEVGAHLVRHQRLAAATQGAREKLERRSPENRAHRLRIGKLQTEIRATKARRSGNLDEDLPGRD